MKIAIIGQQDFGKAVLEAFVEARRRSRGRLLRSREGGRAARTRCGRQPTPWRSRSIVSSRCEIRKRPGAMKAAGADIGIMAFVLQFAPQEFVNIPRHGTIQYHPSLLPKYRGPSSINWPIIKGETETGLTIFRPDRRARRGRRSILQKTTPIGPDDTLGSVYFDRLFPMGVQALLEAADLGRRRHAPGDRAGRVAGELRGLVPHRRGAGSTGPSPSTTSTT